jgi:hypothetical protein
MNMGIGYSESSGLKATTGRKMPRKKSDVVNMAAIVARAEKGSGMASMRKLYGGKKTRGGKC